MEMNLPEIKELTEAIRGLTAVLVEKDQRSVQAPIPTAAPAAVSAAAPIQPAAPAGVPTVASVPVSAAPAYTLEQLSLAARQLAGAGRMTEVQQLVAQFGVNTIAQLPAERYGDFATALRGMGAQI